MGHIVKITLEDTHPPVWRRVVLPEHISFWALHCIIQAAFGWEDDHLHEFTFPRRNLRIGAAAGDFWSDVLDEEEADVDDFLMSHKWIRYTYDFGDDWRHKIVYEKEEPEYGERYATVRKAKGDHFMEDSGGIWGDLEDARIPFDLNAVNQALERMKFSVAESSAETKEMVEALTGMEEVEKWFQRMVKECAEDYNKAYFSFNDLVGKKLEQWEQFYDKWEGQPKEKPGPLTGEYEQMILPGIRLPEKPLRSRGYSFEKRNSPLTQEELLGELNQKQAEDYCKYLRIPAENLNKKQQIAAISAFLQKQPEYLLYVLCQEDLEYLREILALPDGAAPAPPDCFTVHRLVSLGLMDMIMEKKGKAQQAVFCLAADAGYIVKLLTEPLCRKTYQMLEETDPCIGGYILAYGLIELDTLYEWYSKDIKKHVEKEDFLRLVYWHGNFANLFQTVYRPDGTSYAASLQLDVATIMKKRLQYSEHTGYYPFSADERKAMSVHGYNAVYPFWGELADYFYHILEMDAEEGQELLNECFLFVINGSSAATVLELIEEWYEPETLAEWIQLWYILTRLCLHTGLPMLKGYSRVDYGKKNHQNPYSLDLVDEDCEEYAVEEDTALFYMPCRIQQEVMESLEIGDVSLRIKELERLKRKLGVENGELLFLLATLCIEAEKYSKAETYVQALLRAWPEDQSVQMMEDSLTEQIRRMAGILYDSSENIRDMAETADSTYRRRAAKVGRNDPCPCGSGRKYKHCCGKNT